MTKIRKKNHTGYDKIYFFIFITKKAVYLYASKKLGFDMQQFDN